MTSPDNHPLPPLPDDLLAATFLPPGDLERASARARAFATSPSLGQAFDLACADQDTVHFAAHEILPPTDLTARLLNLPNTAAATTESAPDQLSDSHIAQAQPTPALTDRLLAFPDAQPPAHPRFKLSPKLRALAALLFLALTASFALYQLGVFTPDEDAAVRRRLTQVASLVVQAPPAPAAQLPATDPAAAVTLLKEKAPDACAGPMPVVVLNPAPTYALTSVGATPLNGRPTLFATYAGPQGSYTLYQIPSSSLNLPNDYPAQTINTNGKVVTLWPNPIAGCTWACVSTQLIQLQRTGY